MTKPNEGADGAPPEPYISGEAERTASIQTQNDALRQNFVGGRVLMTNGVQALGDEIAARVIAAVQAFEAFNQDNDPFCLHDCALLNVEGVDEKVMFKVDAYDRALTYGSPDEADPKVTTRVMTILLASEY